MTYIIAEIGQNHEGNAKQCRRLVDAAIASGVDAVKMQHFRADTLVTRDLKPMAHSATHATMHERFKSLELPWGSFVAAQEKCELHGVDFIISPFDLDSFEQCAELADWIKIASGELTHQPMLQKATTRERPVILSTGMATTAEIDAAVSQIKPWAILHCVSLYPTPNHLAQLDRITRMRDRYPNTLVGYSDHCVGSLACQVAIAMGAEVIEKHFTITPEIITGDHPHSLSPSQMADLCEQSPSCTEVSRVDSAFQQMMIEELIGTDDERPDLGMRKWLRRGKDGLRDGTGG